MKGAEVKVCVEGHVRFYLSPDLKGTDPFNVEEGSAIS